MKPLDAAIAQFTPEIAAAAREAVAKMRARLPGAFELVYDKANALVVGFSPTEKPSDAIISIVVYPRYLMLYFLAGAVLPDPAGRLQGQGKVGRHIKFNDAATLDEPAVRELIDDAVELAGWTPESGKKGKTIMRQVTEKPRRRRPPAPAARY
jgi:hypothetical protein